VSSIEENETSPITNGSDSERNDPSPLSSFINSLESGNVALNFFHPSLASLFLPIQTIKLYILLDIKYPERVISCLSYFVSFEEEDFMMKFLKDSLYSEQELEDNFINLENSEFNFRSNYGLILGTKIALRLILIPVFMILLEAITKSLNRNKDLNKVTPKIVKSKLKKKNTKPIKKKNRRQFAVRFIQKLLISIYLMTQFESFSYLVSSARANPTIIDLLGITFNVFILSFSQLLIIKLSLRKNQ